ncbi:MAG: hypothetical protein KDK27_03170, partial [Leptospiraceae bacterium]|nr:hypothetical protein [Leptospiraceae bacterium]
REAKQKQDDHLSMAIKILMNSFYGVMGSPGCRFYHPDLPTAITRTGQWLLLQSRAELEKRGFEVLYGDTDSLFIALRAADLADPFQAGELLAASMNAFWSERIRNEYGSPSYLELEFEKYYRRFFLPPARGGGSAKKRYAGELMYPDGHTEIQFAGMEVVRSDWTALAKDFQRELYRLVFAGLPVEEWIKSFVQALKDGQYNEKLIYRKRLRKDVKEYVKNVPQHVRAAKLLDRPVREVRYLMTHDGPIPVQLNPANIDYEYYIEHQLKPIADTVLGALNTGFDEITKPTQLNLF